MMFWHKRQPLLHCEVVHALPAGCGSVAGRCAIWACTPPKSGNAWKTCRRSAPRKSTLSRENVLLHFDRAQASAQDVLELAQLVVGSYSLTAYKAERAEQNRPTVNERRLQEGSLSEMLVRIGVTGATLAFYFFRRPSGDGPATFPPAF